MKLQPLNLVCKLTTRTSVQKCKIGDSDDLSFNFGTPSISLKRLSSNATPADCNSKRCRYMYVHRRIVALWLLAMGVRVEVKPERIAWPSYRSVFPPVWRACPSARFANNLFSSRTTVLCSRVFSDINRPTSQRFYNTLCQCTRLSQVAAIVVEQLSCRYHRPTASCSVQAV